MLMWLINLGFAGSTPEITTPVSRIKMVIQARDVTMTPQPKNNTMVIR